MAYDLADPLSHPEWATEFFAGPARAIGDGDFEVIVPRMGGDARFRVDADPDCGRIDLYLRALGSPYGSPLPVRVIPNGDGVDVLFTLTRFPGQTEEDWVHGLASMARELERLKERHQKQAP